MKLLNREYVEKYPYQDDIVKLAKKLQNSPESIEKSRDLSDEEIVEIFNNIGIFN